MWIVSLFFFGQNLKKLKNYDMSKKRIKVNGEKGDKISENIQVWRDERPNKIG